ncbi:hypothetical protein LUW74_35015 [Actinomadura madurae]|uniref:hypothetical protein n=1 Tax=Actinomadura madurae TaxID=1993 RepID=UPI0020274103|nr:hypothetical protein [Actinomadura madurae]URN08066.1 hypothetical protein LUW74_35015 [Actinomadura madurae]
MKHWSPLPRFSTRIGAVISPVSGSVADHAAAWKPTSRRSRADTPPNRPDASRAPAARSRTARRSR